MISFANISGRLRNLLNPPFYSVSWDRLGITLGQLFFYYYPKKWSLPWECIVSIHGQKVDNIGYEENYFIFKDRGGKWFSVGELDKGFSDFELEIFRRYPDIKRGWMAELEMNPAGIEFLLWPREKSAPSDRKMRFNKRARTHLRASRMRRRTRG